MKIFTTTLLPALAAVTVLASGCDKESKAEDAPAETTSSSSEPDTAKAEPSPAEIEVAELDRLLSAEPDKVSVLDANGDSVRKKFGKIPGAKLLSGYDWTIDELPEDKAEKLVFYCSNKKCGAAPTAAKKALLAGYNDVNVLRVGIMGWTEAGKDTETVQ